MIKVTRNIEFIKCRNCGFEWIPRIANPRRCPRCFIILEPPIKNPRRPR